MITELVSRTLVKNQKEGKKRVIWESNMRERKKE